MHFPKRCKRNNMTKRTKINQAEMDKLDEIYQKSIEELAA